MNFHNPKNVSNNHGNDIMFVSQNSEWHDHQMFFDNRNSLREGLGFFAFDELI